MILNTRAEYDPHTDSVQVAIVVQDDNRQSASDLVTTGVVEIKSFDEVMFAAEFDKTHKVLWVEEDSTVSDGGQFYVFLLHPPMHRNMSVHTKLSFSDGSFVEDNSTVRVSETTDEGAWQNPVFGGIEQKTYEPDFTVP